MKTAAVTASFGVIKHAIAKQFELMKNRTLYRTAADAALLWDLYLASFPDGTNPKFRERTDHDCSCCRHFVKTMGGVVAVDDKGRLMTIWDNVGTGTFYDEVAKAMARFVRGHSIENVFLHAENVVGVEKTFEEVTDPLAVKMGGVARVWEHFHLRLPDSVVRVKNDIGPARAEAQATFDVFKRSLEELTMDAVDTVLELIDQNSLYRGEEQKFALTEFRKLKQKYEKVGMDAGSATEVAKLRDLFCWDHAGQRGANSVLRIRNTAVGTLLQDLSADMDLEQAVKRFESVMAPSNYKRPTALVTKAMIANAQLQIEALGLTSALERRHARLEDVTAANVLWTVRKTQRAKNVFEELTAATPENGKKLDRVEEINIERFLEDVLPRAQSVELMVENRHAGNLVSLIAPVDPGAGRLFKWPNNFSWSYAGEVADSIKERVKSKGGNVTGDLRCSLAWFNYDDLDLHMKEPAGGVEVYYGNKRSYVTSGVLDVDMNPGGGRAGDNLDARYSRSAVENIAYPSKAKMLEGVYELYVHNYRKMEAVDVGFEVEVEFGGEALSFAYPKAVRDGEKVPVATIEYTRRGGFKILKSLPATSVSRQVWGLTTGTWVPVDVVTLSPNYWQEEVEVTTHAGRKSTVELPAGIAREGVGNKHYFFLLDGCKNEDKARGFYNEFLDVRLEPHRKVFEMVGARMRAEDDGRQLSGLGFSSTQRNSVLARVKGSFERVVKVVF